MSGRLVHFELPTGGLRRGRALSGLALGHARDPRLSMDEPAEGSALRKGRLWGSRGKRLFPPCYPSGSSLPSFVKYDGIR